MAQTDGVLSLIIKFPCSFGQDTSLTFFSAQLPPANSISLSSSSACPHQTLSVSRSCVRIPGRSRGPRGSTRGPQQPLGLTPHVLLAPGSGSQRGSSWRPGEEHQPGALGCPQPVSAMLLLPLMAPFPLPPAASKQC